ncbi:glycosyltransferase family 4 protein [Streptomyces sp. H10-C2]|uniref:glycosyltransferase family 4 protein n=1 Tax=unclassified Streptomyces TaxID=2593676 RepID=UPI0024BBE0B2|nr:MULTISPECIES: glycosyltransferase family 4 protein [unclassified Streptomyces]MDJ0341175.1 glycosyltransferase family 4 protein [Streptomyces sp. PH10-H1]MDJ0369472.1 glycosyltransferase family 4 protein [Streptomyces sp. H10-C2]
MHILITAVGKRTEHWGRLFAALSDRPDVELTVLAADVSRLAEQELTRLAAGRERFRFHLAPHLLSEDRTGHMASVVFRPGSGRLVRNEQPDVIHIIGEAAYLSTRQAIRLRNRYWPHVPITLYAAQNVVTRFPFPFPLLEQHAFRTITHALPITPTALQVLRTKGYHGPATIVPLGVDTDVFQPAPPPQPGPFTVGFVGRLEPHKGISALLRARELLDCRLLVVGDGSLRGEIEQAAVRYPDRIELREWADHAELPSLLARMDALALPSMEVIQRNLVPWIGIPLREQFGRVLVEAMACGIPVVGSAIGDIPYVIGSAGLVFPAGDAPALADRLARIRDNPDQARQLAAAGRRRASAEFSWRHIADTLCCTWRQLTDDAAAARRPMVPSSSPAHAELRAVGGSPELNERIQ